MNKVWSALAVFLLLLIVVGAFSVRWPKSSPSVAVVETVDETESEIFIEGTEMFNVALFEEWLSQMRLADRLAHAGECTYLECVALEEPTDDDATDDWSYIRELRRRQMADRARGLADRQVDRPVRVTMREFLADLEGMQSSSSSSFDEENFSSSSSSRRSYFGNRSSSSSSSRRSYFGNSSSRSSSYSSYSSSSSSYTSSLTPNTDQYADIDEENDQNEVSDCGDDHDNDGDNFSDRYDPDCHDDGNPDNPESYVPSRRESIPLTTFYGEKCSPGRSFVSLVGEETTAGNEGYTFPYLIDGGCPVTGAMIKVNTSDDSFGGSLDF